MTTPDHLRNVGHGPCPCAWCQLMRRKADASLTEKMAALGVPVTKAEKQAK